MNDYNIYIQSINYPTVARGAERLRIVPNPFHTLDMIKQLVHALIDSFHKVGLDFKMNS